MSASFQGHVIADFGHTVVCIDKDVRKIDALKVGKMPIFEPGLQDLVANNGSSEAAFLLHRSH